MMQALMPPIPIETSPPRPEGKAHGTSNTMRSCRSASAGQFGAPLFLLPNDIQLSGGDLAFDAQTIDPGQFRKILLGVPAIAPSSNGAT
jgi:hypothetical protein